MAKGSTGMPRISTTMAMNTPVNTRFQGRLPPMTPSTIIFISIA